MIVSTKISLDMTRPKFGGNVSAVQGDGNTRSVEITLLSGGNPWTPPADVEAAVAYRQPGGTKGLYNQLSDGTPAISITGNVATVILAPQMLAEPGTVHASIVFNDAQLNQLTTFPFTVKVEQNPYAGAQKTDDYIRLQWLEDKLDEYIAKVGGGSAVDPEAVRQIVINYLTANPPTVEETDPTVPAWAKQPKKPTYTAAEVGALSAETLPAAINTALAQAKDSGAFDGAPGSDGNPGTDGYSPTASVTQTDTGAVITVTDKTGATTATLKNGADGQPGPTGATPNIQIGTVDTLAAGSSATASMDGTPENPILNLGIPQGAPGSGGGSGIAVTGATVGQTVKIAAVDDSGVPTAWEPADLPSGDSGIKEWEEFLRFTTDNAETIVFDFSSNGAETLESKKVKEFYLYSPNAGNTGATATALINNRVNLTGLVDFGRANKGSMKFCLRVDSDALTLVYFGRDTDEYLCNATLTHINTTENDGLLSASVGGKNVFRKINDIQNGIPFPSSPVDYIKTVTITLGSACGTGVEFVVYVR